jgi:hypothetical protein
MKNVVFIGMHERTSGITRGIQISQHIPNSKFIDQRNLYELSKIKNSICILIRTCDVGTVNMLHSQGCIVGYDLLDRPVQDYHTNSFKFSWRNYSKLGVDFFIVNNSEYAKTLSTYINAYITAIPHQSVNFEQVIPKFRDNIKTIGYIGVPDQLTIKSSLQQFCDANNFTLITEHPNTRQECVALLSKIDVGVIFIDGLGHKEFVLNYKPNVKLTNFQSFGIPTIACSYKSFIEFGEDAWIRADKEQLFMNELRELCNNNSSRYYIRESSILVGNKFYISEIVKNYYIPLLSKYDGV